MRANITLTFLICVTFLSGYAQTECGTPHNTINKDYSDIIDGRGIYEPNEGPYCVNVYFHIVRQSNGSGGFDPNQIEDIVDNLNDDFNPHNIYIGNTGHEFIDSSFFYNLSDNDFNLLIQFNNVSNAINFYLVNSAPYFGRAEAIESKNLVVINSKALTSTSSHELGHCLNLWHTFQGTAGGEGCPEFTNGSNCNICGDYVCDTPADNNTGNSGGYNPDLLNFMSYYANRERFTNLQGKRMRDALQESPILQSVLGNICMMASTVGDDIVCANEGTVFTIFDASPPYYWSVSTNLTIIQNNGDSISVLANNNYTSEYGYIEVIHAEGTVFKEVWVGRPQTPTHIYGPEMVNSGAIVSYQGGVALGATSYQWWLPYPFDIVSPIDYFNDNWQMYPNNTRFNSHVFTGYGENNGYVQLMGVNKCNVGPAIYLEVVHEGSGGGGGPLPIVNPIPNAADDKFTLDFSDYPEGIYYIYLYDIYSNLVYYGETNNAAKEVSTMHLPNGLYFLHFYNGVEIIQTQLLIQH